MPDAAAALDEAESTEARWSSEAANLARASEVLAAELAEAQARAGDDLLDDGDPEALARIAGELAQRQREQELAVQAVQRAAERLTNARRGVLRARAAALHARAAELRQKVEQRESATERMLAVLADFEGVRYAVADLNSLGVGAGMRSNTATQNLFGRATWLDNRADALERVADMGTERHIVDFVNMPIPEVIPVEEISAVPDSVAV